MKFGSVLGCVLAGYFCLSAHAARAQDDSQESSLGLYVGAGVGATTLRQDPGLETGYYGFSREEFGWDAFIGVRPLPYLGAEIGYLDFGSVRHIGYEYQPATASYSSQLFSHETANAPAAFAVAYLPLPPWWDLYVKAGTARLDKSWDFVSLPLCYSPGACTASGAANYQGSATNWDFAWGLGAQWKLGATAFRLEYLRVQASGFASGDPDMLSVGVSWTFF